MLYYYLSFEVFSCLGIYDAVIGSVGGSFGDASGVMIVFSLYFNDIVVIFISQRSKFDKHEGHSISKEMNAVILKLFNECVSSFEGY